MNIADQTDIDAFLERHPDIQMLELLMPDINGMLRCKRIHRREFSSLFGHSLKAPLSVPLLGIRGDLYDDDVKDKKRHKKKKDKPKAIKGDIKRSTSKRSVADVDVDPKYSLEKVIRTITMCSADIL